MLSLDLTGKTALIGGSTQGRVGLRVVSSMPAWNPGKIHGRKVKVWFAQPVVFRLE
jgi:hypothetical protein